MKIVELTWEYPPHIVGGLGNHIAALAPELSRLGVTVHVVTPHRGDIPAYEQDGLLHVHRVKIGDAVNDLFVDAPKANEHLAAAVDALIDAGMECDLIHAHDWLVASAATAIKHRRKLPLLATIHATERGRWQGNLPDGRSRLISEMEWQLTYEAWRVVTTTRYMAAELKNYLNVPDDKIDVVPNGVAAHVLGTKNGINLSEFRASYAEPEERLVFMVGRVVYEKGAHLLVEAAPRVLAQHPKTRFVIAGTGPMRETLMHRTQELGISQHVRFPGFVSDTERNALYRVADCAVTPSLYEPFGIVALEAMAARCPLVVSNTGGLAEVVQHEVTAYTIFPDSVDSLTHGIVQTLQNPNQARQRAEAAFDYVQNQYHWTNIAQRTLEIMERILTERRNVTW